MRRFRSLWLVATLLLAMALLVACTPDSPANDTDGATDAPTAAPTDAPTEEPTDTPTEAPTDGDTDGDTDAPTEQPTEAPTEPEETEPTVSDGDVVKAEQEQLTHKVQYAGYQYAYSP